MNTKLLLQSLYGELNSIDNILGNIPEEDVLGRLSLENKRTKIYHRIEELAKIFKSTAEVAIYFGGQPVFGQMGVQANFASNQLKIYQDLVAKIIAKNKKGRLKFTGRIAGRDSSNLHITGILHGSFGFILEELNEPNAQLNLIDSDIKIATEEASSILRAMAESDEAIDNIAGYLDPRVFASARAFFRVALHNDAQFRIIDSKNDYSFSNEMVSSAYTRASKITVNEETAYFYGTFKGAILVSRIFEFVQDDKSIVHGKISSYLDEASVAELNINWTNNRCRLEAIKTVICRLNTTKVEYTLVNLTPYPTTFPPSPPPPIALP